MTTSYTLTGDFTNILGEVPRSLKVTVETNLPKNAALVDLDSNEVRLAGPAKIELTDTAFSISLIATGSAGTNLADPSSLRYTIRASYMDGNNERRSWKCKNFALTGNLDLADAIATADPPAEVANAYLDQMRTLLDQALAAVELDTADEALAYSVEHGPLTSAALAEVWEPVVIDATEGHVPGTERAYAEYAAGATGTQVSPSLLHWSNLLLSVTGQGRPVDIEWFIPKSFHSVANTGVVHMMVSQKNGGTVVTEQTVTVRSPLTTDGPPTAVRRRKVLEEGATYVFAFYTGGVAAGTWAAGASGGNQVMYTSVTTR